MRISLIHGEDNTKAYSRFRELVDQSKGRNFEIIPILDPKNIVSQSLFEDKTIFVLEKPNKIKPTSWKWLAKNPSKYNSNLLIYYDGNTPALITKNLPKDSKVEKFDLPKIIFQFLDSFYPGNSKISLKLLNELTKNEPIELIFHLLGVRMRELYWAKVSPETLNFPSWRKTKLINQASQYTICTIQYIIRRLAKIDIKSKTSDLNLKSMLDMLILKSLK